MRVTAYETKDGMIFKDRTQAAQHEAWLELVAVCRRMLLSEVLELEDGAPPRPIDDDAIGCAAFLVLHQKEITRLSKKAHRHDDGTRPPAATEAPEDGE